MRNRIKWVVEFSKQYWFSGIWVGLLLGGGVRLDRLGTSRTFFFDEWSLVLGRWPIGIGDLLEPHNGHLSFVPFGIYAGLVRIVGLGHYRVYRWVGISFHFVVVTLVLLYVLRRLGRIPALGVGIGLLLLGAGWQNILWPFQIGFMGSVGCYVASLIVLDRKRRNSATVASFLLFLSIASSGVGVPLTIAVIVETYFLTSKRTRLWIGGAPLVAYGIWYLYFGISQATIGNLVHVPSYLRDSAVGAVGGLYSLPPLWDVLVTGMTIGVLLVALIVGKRGSPRIVGLLVGIIGFWTATALSRGDLGEPSASRYVYVGVVLFVLLLSEATQEVSSIPSKVVWLIAGIGSVVATSPLLGAGAEGLRYSSQRLSAELAVVELLRESVPAGYQPDPIHAPQIMGDRYLQVVDQAGASPAVPIEIVVEMPNFARESADRIQFELAPPVASAVTSVPERCELVHTEGIFLNIYGGETVLVGSFDVPVDVFVWRFSEAPQGSPFISVQSKSVVTIQMPIDAANLPWKVKVSKGGNLFKC